VGSRNQHDSEGSTHNDQDTRRLKEITSTDAGSSDPRDQSDRRDRYTDYDPNIEATPPDMNGPLRAEIPPVPNYGC
jgi:hypothetical protein